MSSLRSSRSRRSITRSTAVDPKDLENALCGLLNSAQLSSPSPTYRTSVKQPKLQRHTSDDERQPFRLVQRQSRHAAASPYPLLSSPLTSGDENAENSLFGDTPSLKRPDFSKIAARRRTESAAKRRTRI